MAARPLAMPSSCCHLAISCCTRSCLVILPRTPATRQHSASSPDGRASSSSFFLTTTARRRASCARWSARALASNASSAATFSSLLPCSRPLLTTICFRSAAAMAFSSFFRSAATLSSSLARRSSWLISSPSSSASSSVSSSSPSFSLAMPRRPVAPPAFTRRPPLLPASLRMRRSWSTTKCASRSARPPAYREPRASASRPSPGSAPAMLQAPAYWASDRAPPLAAAHSCPSSSKSRRPSLSASKNRSSEATFC
mmetsp:Transcript_44367/g.127004  ORF Transcript_44367/g.127004 Transcript_44367/m.127004 type:complete len:255 (-) Transcript_44367:744-1508(-)